MISFRTLSDEFLVYSGLHQAKGTKRNYENSLQQFMSYLGDDAEVSAEDIKPHQVRKWIDTHHEEWGNSYKNGHITNINTVFNWGISQGHIDKNPIKTVKKPSPDSRDNPMSKETYEAFLYQIDRVTGDLFRDLFIFVWHTGVRPQEIRHIEARHFDEKKSIIVFPPIEAKGKKYQRTIYMDDAALAIVQRLAGQHPKGKLFRNERGDAWTKDAICQRMARLSEKVGIEHCLYDMRHSFCQRLLEAGWSTIDVKEAMGHRSTAMVDRIYSHMNKAQSHIQDKMRNL